jgi:hypothetical protein
MANIKDTYWSNGMRDISLLEILDYTSAEEVIDARSFESLLIKVKRQEDRISKADLSYPIVVSIYKGIYTQVLDGQHRVVKAIRGDKTVKVKFLDLDTAPKYIKDIFSND